MNTIARAASLLTAIVVLSSPLSAQTRTFELRPFVGAFIPTGDLADVFKSATTVGGQAAVELSSRFHVLATVDWTSSRNKLVPTSTGTDIWQYDAGIEANVIRTFNPEWRLRPFAGLGGGARTYNYEAAGLKSNTCTAGYGALGSELEGGLLAFRLEARDYVSCFESPSTGRKRTRNDVGLSFGVAYHFR